MEFAELLSVLKAKMDELASALKAAGLELEAQLGPTRNGTTDALVIRRVGNHTGGLCVARNDPDYYNEQETLSLIDLLTTEFLIEVSKHRLINANWWVYMHLESDGVVPIIVVEFWYLPESLYWNTQLQQFL